MHALLTALAGLSPDQPAARLMIVLGGRDEVAPPALCQELLKRQGGDGVTVKLYPEARHGFDAEGLPPERRYPFGVIGYHAESSRAAWSEIEQFLRP